MNTVTGSVLDGAWDKVVSNAYDLWFVLALIVAVVITLGISRMGVLPKKWLWLVPVAVFGGFALLFSRNRRDEQLRKEIEGLSALIEQKEDDLKNMKAKYADSQDAVRRAEAELSHVRSALRDREREIEERTGNMTLDDFIDS